MIILKNGKPTECTGTEEQNFENGLSIYEVIRIFRSKPIFLNDNLLRLDNSLKKSNIGIHTESLNIPEKLERLIALEHMTEGNLKYVLHFTEGHRDEYIYRIPHAYPTDRNYREGVPVITYPAIRENPEVKYINTGLRNLMNRLIREHQVYEVLLKDPENNITEGSRSNVFFIRENTLYTAPASDVLPGTSRKRVVDLCKDQGIPVVERKMACAELQTYQAAFITGTSPLILPISRIDDLAFNPRHPLLQQLMQWYFALLTAPAGL